jgi:pyruvate formate lyase activating enzyme
MAETLDAHDVLAEHAPPEDIARAAERLGCASVTYNDPTIFHEYVMACNERREGPTEV